MWPEKNHLNPLLVLINQNVKNYVHCRCTRCIVSMGMELAVIVSRTFKGLFSLLPYVVASFHICCSKKKLFKICNFLTFWGNSNVLYWSFASSRLLQSVTALCWTSVIELIYTCIPDICWLLIGDELMCRVLTKRCVIFAVRCAAERSFMLRSVGRSGEKNRGQKSECVVCGVDACSAAYNA